MRVGSGFDVHAFDPSRPLVLAGVTIEGSAGLAGWSDGDVASHAIVDALLGAAGLGDLGSHFPESQVKQGSSSLLMLARTSSLLAEAGYAVGNIDCVVIAQNVRLAHYRPAMSSEVATALGIEAGKVSIKATTTDNLGFTGRGEGIAAIAVALLE